MFGFSENEILQMRIAGNFHDLGKLVIPNSILDKPDKLTEQEFNIIKCHTYYSYHIINSVSGMERIAELGAFHHERLNGKGYPFHLNKDELNIGSRIMAVSDIFTALAEDRPYRDGMKEKEISELLLDFSKADHLDKKIVELLNDNFKEVYHHVKDIQKLTRNFYDARFASLV